MNSLLMLKIGGGVITDKNVRYGLRSKVLTQLAEEIGEAWRAMEGEHLAIGNGSGSYGHNSAKKYRTKEGFVTDDSKIGMGWVRNDAVKLNQLVFEQLLLANVPVFSFSPSSLMSVENDKTSKLFLRSVTTAIENGVVPLLHGDVMVDNKKGCTIYSTERVFQEMAKDLLSKYRIRVLHVSAEEGVYDKGKASIFPEINNDNFQEVKEHLGGSEGVDVTGGMLHKVVEALELTKLGIESQIVSGLIPGRVKKAMLKQVVRGTIIK